MTASTLLHGAMMLTFPKFRFGVAILVSALIASPLQADEPFDVIIRGGTVYDGRGGKLVVADVAVRGDSITKIGDHAGAKGKVESDAKALAVAPGFINMLSWANTALLVDGKAQSDIRQGVTLEIFGEGWSMGPLNESMRREMKK